MLHVPLTLLAWTEKTVHGAVNTIISNTGNNCYVLYRPNIKNYSIKISDNRPSVTRATRFVVVARMKKPRLATHQASLCRHASPGARQAQNPLNAAILPYTL
jgi:hypothetical protein